MIGHPDLPAKKLYKILNITPENLEKYRLFAKERLGFEFNDISLLVTALTHRSYVNEHRHQCKRLEHNERLEYLGDAVLEMVSSDFLIRNYNVSEGRMTSWRAAMVCTNSIGKSGEELGYAPLVRLSRGEQHGDTRGHLSIIADCFEAVIGAIYVDQGYAEAKAFIEKWITVKMPKIIEEESWRDPKSYVQEFCQKRNEGITPVYQVLKESGPDHDRTFVIGLFVLGHMLGIGTGHSKQDAQAEAAKKAVRYYKELIARETASHEPAEASKATS